MQPRISRVGGGGQRRGSGGGWERGEEKAMNDRNQRNTAPRKLPGIHPEYIIHTGVPLRPPLSLGREVAGGRSAPRKRSVPAMDHEAADFFKLCSLLGPPRITKPDRVNSSRIRFEVPPIIY